MPFIGKAPETGAFRLIDSITTSATDTYALTVQGDYYFPASARNLIVSLNGVTQAPETAYTVSGSHIVFASALTSSDVIDYILVIGDAVDIGTPSDGTVGNAQLKASLDFSGKTLTFSNDQISGNAVDGGTISNFASTGIDDNATSTALTVTDSGIAATLTTAAQPNITSVGNLSALTVTGDLTVDTTTLIVDSTNNRVGIGESNPSYLLDLKGGTNDSIRLNALSGAFIFANGSGVDKGSLSMSGGNMDIAADAGIDFYSGGSPLSGDPQVTIDSAGLLGIGEPTPSRKLHVNAGSVQVTSIFESTSSNVFIDFANSATSEGRTRIGCEGADTLTFRTATAERLRISATGVLSITDSTGGNTNLDIYSSGTSGFLKGRRGVTTEIELGAADITFDSGGSTIMTMKNGGKVGVGHSNPQAKLAVLGSSNDTISEVNANLCVEGGGGNGIIFGTQASSPFRSYIQSGFVSNFSLASYDLLLNPLGGTVEIGGNLKVANGYGIDFSAFSNAAGMTSELLDDYEEGTWTPVVGTTGTASTVSYTLQSGYYTKIGDRVFYNIYLNFNVTTGGSGFFYVTLPFTIKGGYTYAAQSIAYQNVYTVAAGNHLGCYTEQNSSFIYFTQNNSIQGAPTSGARTLMVAGQYPT